MTKDEAQRLINKYYRNDNPSEDDEFLFIEACQFLIESENNADAMVSLGGLYYSKEKYELAEKYYLMADDAGDKWAADGLGYIYYYGRVGPRDYKKAFHYYSIAKENGNLEAAMKIADMYHNGYGVDKDEEKYKALIREIYEQIKYSDDLNDPYPEVAYRLADIFIKEGNPMDGLDMLIRAKSFIGQRIRFNPFWGNFIVCRRIITLLYQIVEFNKEHFDFFDLFYLLSKPHIVKLIYNGKKYLIESLYDEGDMRVQCDGKYFKSIENFLTNALFYGKHAYIIEYDDFYQMEIIQ